MPGNLFPAFLFPIFLFQIHALSKLKLAGKGLVYLTGLFWVVAVKNTWNDPEIESEQNEPENEQPNLVKRSISILVLGYFNDYPK